MTPKVLQRPTLILNRNWQPVIGGDTRACSWESSQPPKLTHGVQILTLVLGRPSVVSSGVSVSDAIPISDDRQPMTPRRPAGVTDA